MKNKQTQTSLVRLKAAYGAEAEFLSKESFPFNIFDSEWTLNGLGNKGAIADLNWLVLSEFDLEDQLSFRFSLADLAKRCSANTVIKANKAIENSLISKLSIESIKEAFLRISKTDKGSFRQIIFAFYNFDPEKSLNLYEWIISIPNENVESNIYDPESGALSDIENQSFNIAMNQRSKKTFERGFESKVDNKPGINLITYGRNFIAARLMQVLIRRASNLIQLKWSDIYVISDSTCFQTDSELMARVFKAKQRANFREKSESEPIALGYETSKELLQYKVAYSAMLKKTLLANNIKLTDSEFIELISRCPILFADSIFKTKFKDKQQLFSAISAEGSGYHLDSVILNNNIYKLYQSLDVHSDRLSREKLKIGNNRIRHTAGTKAARDNLPITQIAKLLGNTPSAAKVYVDLSDEQRAEIDEKFIANSFLAKAFSTSISDTVSQGEILIENDFGEQTGKSKNLPNCISCHRKRPIGCYGCDNFSALATADHNRQLTIANKTYSYRLDTGDSPDTLIELKKQIIYIEATILACNKVLKHSSKLEL
ncbi:MAG: hypothetical protein ACI9YH_001911 [Colwellia sp.]|jgi:hypothetical protein